MKKKQALKVMGMVLAGSLVLSEAAPMPARAAAAAQSSQEEGKKGQETARSAVACYIDTENGKDTADGSSPENAVKTLKQARTLYQNLGREESGAILQKKEEESEKDESGQEEITEAYFVFCGFSQDELQEFLEEQKENLKKDETLLPEHVEAVTEAGYERILAEDTVTTPVPGDVPVPDEEPAATPTPGEMPDEEPAATPTPGEKPDEEPTVTPTPGEKPDEEPTETPTPDEKPDEEPTVTPEPGEKPDGEPTVTPAPDEKPDEEPTVTPEPGEKPDEEPTVTPTPGEKPDEEPTVTPTPGEKPDEEPTVTPAPDEKPDGEPTATPTPGEKPDEEPTVTPAPDEKPDGEPENDSEEEEETEDSRNDEEESLISGKLPQNPQEDPGLVNGSVEKNDEFAISAIDLLEAPEADTESGPEKPADEEEAVSGEEEYLMAEVQRKAPSASEMAEHAGNQTVSARKTPGNVIVGPDNYDKKPTSAPEKDESAEKPAATEAPKVTEKPSSGRSDTGATKTPQKKTDTETSVKTHPVQTGDTAMILPFSISTVLSALVLAMLSALHIQTRRRERDLAWRRFREENPLSDDEK